MPWWAIAYLVILSTVILISIIKDYYEKRGFAYITGEFIPAHWVLFSLWVIGRKI